MIDVTYSNLIIESSHKNHNDKVEFLKLINNIIDGKHNLNIHRKFKSIFNFRINISY